MIDPPKKLTVLQIAYCNTTDVEGVIYHLNPRNGLPKRLVDLLSSRRIAFSGCQVGGDIAKLNRDFALRISMQKVYNLAGMALSRGVVLRAKGLDTVAPAVIGKSCPKDCQRLNWGWNGGNMSLVQKSMQLKMHCIAYSATKPFKTVWTSHVSHIQTK